MNKWEPCRRRTETGRTQTVVRFIINMTEVELLYWSLFTNCFNTGEPESCVYSLHLRWRTSYFYIVFPSGSLFNEIQNHSKRALHYFWQLTPVIKYMFHPLSLLALHAKCYVLRKGDEISILSDNFSSPLLSSKVEPITNGRWWHWQIRPRSFERSWLSCRQFSVQATLLSTLTLSVSRWKYQSAGGTGW